MPAQQGSNDGMRMPGHDADTDDRNSTTFVRDDSRTNSTNGQLTELLQRRRTEVATLLIELPYATRTHHQRGSTSRRGR